MHVRPYENSDEQEVIVRWEEVFPDAPSWNDPASDIRRKLGVQRELFLVAELDGGVAGTAMGGYDGHRAWVYYVVVSSGARRRGVGTALMREVERLLEGLGAGKLNLQVRAGSDEAVAFYRSLGYSVEDRVSMGKRLGSR